MSEQRSISFGANEKSLMKFFDTGGKSALAKTALEYYRQNLGLILTEPMRGDILVTIAETCRGCDRVINHKVYSNARNFGKVNAPMR
jgi:hypothetical protein